MTEQEQAAQQMRREVKGLCLWCGGAAEEMTNPRMWDPVDASDCWPAGMCEDCHDGRCPTVVIL